MKGGKPLSEILVPVGIFVMWIVLSRWILPRMGVQT